MTTTLSYAPTGARPKISRDKVAVLLAVISALVAVAFRCSQDEWLDAYTNGQIRAALRSIPYLTLAWLIITVWLPLRVAVKFRSGTMHQRLHWVLLLALITLP
jgi:hypothetical protein